jgi:hypothetical protein
MLYGDYIEWFETVDYLQVYFVFLDDAEPSRSIGGVRSLIYTCIDLSVNDSAYLVVYSRWYRHVP